MQDNKKRTTSSGGSLWHFYLRDFGGQPNLAEGFSPSSTLFSIKGLNVPGESYLLMEGIPATRAFQIHNKYKNYF
jgi:hypothetical protein